MCSRSQPSSRGIADEQPGVALARLGDGDTAAGGLEECPALTEREGERLARIAGRPQVLTQRVEELEELEFP